MRRVASALPFLLVFLAVARAQGETPSVSPYIDSVRGEIKDQPASGSYSEGLQKKLREKDLGQPTDSYTEQLKKELNPPQGEAPSYIDQQRALLAPKKEGGAIEAVKEGHSELQARYEGDIHHSAGFRFGASINRTISAAAGVQGAGFSDVYGNGFVPDLSVFYEYQPWHSEWYGNLGLVASVGIGVFQGTGIFAYNLAVPDGSGNTFGTTSHVSSQFFDLPMVVALNYRFNLFRLFRPFVMAGPTLIGFYEQRNDGAPAHQSDARGIFASGGVSILLDWISQGARWDLYSEHGIKHYYVTVEYDQISTFSGPVNFTASGIFAGLTFEF